MAGSSGGKASGFWAAFIGAFIAAVIIGFIAGGGSKGRTTQSAPDAEAAGGAEAASEAEQPNPYAGFRVADFALIDQDGAPVDQSLFDGEVTVLAFFFTSCNGPCPAIARVMNDIQGRTTGTDLRLASISVDGGRDTPQVIASFAESYGASPDRWRFLTGDPDLVRELVRESIGFELREQEGVAVPTADGATMNNILHPTRLLLVGPERTLIGIYPFNDPAQIDALVADARAALG